MSRAEAIKAYREARDEADMILVGYILEHPDTNLEGLCKEADSDNWKALASRLRYRLKKARSENESGRTISDTPPEAFKGAVRGAKSAMRKHPELAAQILNDPQVADAVIEAAVANPETNKVISQKRHEHDTERRAVAEVRTPSRRDSREDSEQADFRYELTRIGNWAFGQVDTLKAWELTDEERDELVQRIEKVRAAMDALETALDMDQQLATLLGEA